MPMPGGEEAAPGGDAGGVEGLDEQLDASLEDFDETVMGDAAGSGSEEIDILNPMGGGSSGMESNEPIFEEGDLSEADGGFENEDLAQRAADGAAGMEGSDSAEGPSSGGGAAPPQGQQGGTGSTTAGEAGDADIIPIPDDIGDGRDDDIVLRQVREAAMKERDPVLREKLWDEYRRIRDQR